MDTVIVFIYIYEVAKERATPCMPGCHQNTDSVAIFSIYGNYASIGNAIVHIHTCIKLYPITHVNLHFDGMQGRLILYAPDSIIPT